MLTSLQGGISRGLPAWTTGLAASERPTSPMTTLASVRVARHPDFDRVVLEFSGDDLPGYHVEYVDRPLRECGSGNAVQVAGDEELTRPAPDTSSPRLPSDSETPTYSGQLSRTAADGSPIAQGRLSRWEKGSSVCLLGEKQQTP